MGGPIYTQDQSQSSRRAGIRESMPHSPNKPRPSISANQSHHSIPITSSTPAKISNFSAISTYENPPPSKLPTERENRGTRQHQGRINAGSRQGQTRIPQFITPT